MLFSGRSFTDVKHGILSADEDLIDEKTLNLHLLREGIEAGQAWSRNGELVCGESTASQNLPARESLPRLSLTIRTLTNSIEAEAIESESNRADDLARLSMFYKSVSEST